MTRQEFEAVREACAKVCDKSAASYRGMKGPYTDDDGNEIIVSDDEQKECEELAYCCELNAKWIRALTPSNIPGVKVDEGART